MHCESGCRCVGGCRRRRRRRCRRRKLTEKNWEELQNENWRKDTLRIFGFAILLLNGVPLKMNLGMYVLWDLIQRAKKKV